MESAVCPYCSSDVPLSSFESHIIAHEVAQSDEEYARYLVAQEEQSLNEKAALGLVQHDIENREKYEAKSPLSSVVTTPEQLALALQKSKAEEKDGQNKGPTAIDFNTHFLANVDKSHRQGDDQIVAETSHVILFDIDNCGGEFEQIADAFVQMPKILVYVVGGPGLPNVSNVKLPTFAEMYQTKRLHVIPLTKKGKNAADFVLSFYGGILHERLPLQIPFVVISKDKGLSQLIEHLHLLGRAAQLISTDIVKHLSTKILSFPSTQPTHTTTNPNPNPNTNTNTNTNAKNTNTDSATSAPNTNKTDTDPNIAGIANINIAQFDNPFLATEFSLEQAAWYIVSNLSKIDAAQRPKTRQKLENVVGGLLTKIPGKKPDAMTPGTLIDSMQKQNFVFLDGSKVVYLF
eukprot:Phypoly_transcript_10779.p1 GENE.Phypoly_transcript_10779~~Phypoly_transcript_10779.p1  ORF type:complete len:404 (+),score=77.14 Phypoly_transcript_10779:27-1238(+)